MDNEAKNSLPEQLTADKLTSEAKIIEQNLNCVGLSDFVKNNSHNNALMRRLMLAFPELEQDAHRRIPFSQYLDLAKKKSIKDPYELEVGSGNYLLSDLGITPIADDVDEYDVLKQLVGQKIGRGMRVSYRGIECVVFGAYPEIGKIGEVLKDVPNAALTLISAESFNFDA